MVSWAVGVAKNVYCEAEADGCWLSLQVTVVAWSEWAAANDRKAWSVARVTGAVTAIVETGRGRDRSWGRSCRRSSGSGSCGSRMAVASGFPRVDSPRFESPVVAVHSSLVCPVFADDVVAGSSVVDDSRELELTIFELDGGSCSGAWMSLLRGTGQSDASVQVSTNREWDEIRFSLQTFWRWLLARRIGSWIVEHSSSV